MSWEAIVDSYLESWATSLSDPKGALATILRFVSSPDSIGVEFVLLDLLGLAIDLGRRLAREPVARVGAPGARAPGQTGLAPLDDRAATPL